jgi:hypothetical protein
MNAITTSATTGVITNLGTLSPNRLIFADPQPSNSIVPAKISGLKKDLYSVRVRAINTAGNGKLSVAKRLRL